MTWGGASDRMAAQPGLYFLALIPPPPIYEQALALKKHFSEMYQSKAALRSPPHITLHMPFDWKVAKEELLIGSLEKLSANLSPARVVLEDFGCFTPRVIFIKVNFSEELAALQKKVKQFCRRELNLFNADYKDIPFHPHLTVAFRDLRKPMFAKGWEEFKTKEFHGEFLAANFSLLKHDGARWNVLRDFAIGH